MSESFASHTYCRTDEPVTGRQGNGATPKRRETVTAGLGTVSAVKGPPKELAPPLRRAIPQYPGLYIDGSIEGVEFLSLLIPVRPTLSYPTVFTIVFHSSSVRSCSLEGHARLPLMAAVWTTWASPATFELSLGRLFFARRYRLRECYQSLTAHQHQKGHTVPKQVITIATSIQVFTV